MDDYIDVTMQFFAEPEQLFIWQKRYTEHNFDVESLKILIDYMKGHDYMLGAIGKTMIRVDLQDEESFDRYSIEEAINAVCEWNESLIEDEKASVEQSVDLTQEELHQHKLEDLEKDSETLGNMFKTCMQPNKAPVKTGRNKR